MHDRFLSFLRAKAPALLYMGIIFFMSSLKGYEVPEMPFRFGDKFVHFLEYGLLGMFLYHFFRYPKPFVSHPWRAASIVGVLYAASDEIHQLFVPGRFCEFADFVVDCLGVFLFAAISAKLNPVERQSEAVKQAEVRRQKLEGEKDNMKEIGTEI